MQHNARLCFGAGIYFRLKREGKGIFSDKPFASNLLYILIATDRFRLFASLFRFLYPEGIPSSYNGFLSIDKVT